MSSKYLIPVRLIIIWFWFEISWCCCNRVIGRPLYETRVYIETRRRVSKSRTICFTTLCFLLFHWLAFFFLLLFTFYNTKLILLFLLLLLLLSANDFFVFFIRETRYLSIFWSQSGCCFKGFYNSLYTVYNSLTLRACTLLTIYVLVAPWKQKEKSCIQIE